LWILLGFALSWVLIRFSDQYYNGWDSPRVFFHENSLKQAFSWNFENTAAIFGGFYFYNAFLEIPLWWKIGLYVVILVFLVLMLYLSRNFPKWILVLWLGTLVGHLFFTGLFGVYSPRYLLGFYFAWFFFILYNAAYKDKFYWMGLCFLVSLQLAGIFVGSKLKREWYPNSQNQLQALEELHKEVEKRKKKAVFVSDNLGQWQWNYLYGDKIPATAFRRKERVMRYTEKVYHYYDRNPNDVAIVGLWGVFWGMDSLEGFNDHRFQVAEKYYYMDHNLPKYIGEGEALAK
jgi:hypothetical protein